MLILLLALLLIAVCFVLKELVAVRRLRPRQRGSLQAALVFTHGLYVKRLYTRKAI
jgi:hypothetical protein